jgi:hypothetical protein
VIEIVTGKYVGSAGATSATACSVSVHAGAVSCQSTQGNTVSTGKKLVSVVSDLLF